MKSNRNLALVGLIILSYLIYRRLFKIRLPKEILSTNDIFIICLYLSLCITALILVIINIYLFTKIILNNKTKSENNKSNNLILTKITEIFKSKYNPFKIISDSLFALDIYLKNKIPLYDKHRDYLDVVIMLISKQFCKYKKISLFLFICIPIVFQSIVLGSLFIDIYIIEKFCYFYKYLWLLIFPLIANYILYSIHSFIDTNLKSLNNVLNLRVVKASEYKLDKTNTPEFEVSVQDWKDIVDNTPEGLYLCINTLSNDFTKDKPMLDHAQTLEYCVDSMNEFFIIQAFLDKYTKVKNKILLPFNALKYFIYALCWGYILFLIF